MTDPAAMHVSLRTYAAVLKRGLERLTRVAHDLQICSENIGAEMLRLSDLRSAIEKAPRRRMLQEDSETVLGMLLACGECAKAAQELMTGAATLLRDGQSLLAEVLEKLRREPDAASLLPSRVLGERLARVVCLINDMTVRGHRVVSCVTTRCGTRDELRRSIRTTLVTREAFAPAPRVVD